MMKDCLSQIVMPDGQAKLPLYNLENQIRAMGKLENSYVIGILDCCREPYNEKTQSMFQQMATRGGDEEKQVKVKDPKNAFLIFGCPP